MLDESMLAKDRRRESCLLAITSVLLLLELWGVPLLAERVLIDSMTNLRFLLGVCISSLVAAWSTVRLYRLFRKRSLLFRAGIFVWIFLYMSAVTAELGGVNMTVFGLQVSWVILFMCTCMLVTGLVKLGKFGFAHELGWPLLKPIHWLYSIPVLLLYMVGLLDSAQVFLYANVGIFLITRYSYNRWIYATRVLYPYKPTAAKFYIKHLR